MYSANKQIYINNHKLGMIRKMTERGHSEEEIANALQQYDVEMYEGHLRKIEKEKRRLAIYKQKKLAESLMTEKQIALSKKQRALKHKVFQQRQHDISKIPRYYKYQRFTLTRQLHQEFNDKTESEFRMRSRFIMETLKRKMNEFVDIVSAFSM